MAFDKIRKATTNPLGYTRANEQILRIVPVFFELGQSSAICEPTNVLQYACRCTRASTHTSPGVDSDPKARMAWSLHLGENTTQTFDGT